MIETSLRTKLNHWKTASLVVFTAPALVWTIMQGYRSAWTGFGDASLTVKTLWDWMTLLLVPLCLGAGAWLLNRSARENARQQSDERSTLEHEIETDRQQEGSLQAYFDRMAELLLKEKLSKFSPDEVRNVARIRTLAVLRALDAKRKGSVLLFLRDSKLIERDAVIDLCGADLRGVSLVLANLKNINLAEADMRHADLRGANLTNSYLGGTNLMKADLTGANLGCADLFDACLNNADLSLSYLRSASLNGADLRGCRLNEADIRDADLSGSNLNVSDLVRADLRGAKLGGVKLLGADLSQADLSGSQVTGSELEQAKSLEGAILPDGTKHD